MKNILYLCVEWRAMSQWKSEGVRTIAICLRNKRERDRGGRKRGSVRKSEIEGENQRERDQIKKNWNWRTNLRIMWNENNLKYCIPDKFYTHWYNFNKSYCLVTQTIDIGMQFLQHSQVFAGVWVRIKENVQWSSIPLMSAIIWDTLVSIK